MYNFQRSIKMDHVAIMKKSWGLVPKILSGEKKIESRWYLTRYAPWDRIKAGDLVYFKNSGEPVTVKAKVWKVLQFSGLTPKKVEEILVKYGKDDGIAQEAPGNKVFLPRDWKKTVPTAPLVQLKKFYHLFKNKKYCLLIFLKNPVKIKPFEIDKTGFGMMSAWITVKSINQIKISLPDTASSGRSLFSSEKASVQRKA